MLVTLFFHKPPCVRTTSDSQVFFDRFVSSQVRFESNSFQVQVRLFTPYIRIYFLEGVAWTLLPWERLFGRTAASDEHTKKKTFTGFP